MPAGLADGFGLKELAYPLGIHPGDWVPRSPPDGRLARPPIEGFGNAIQLVVPL